MVLIITAFSLLIISFGGFYFSIKPSKIISSITPHNLGLSFEEVFFTTEDGLRLSGWFIPSQAKSEITKTIICLHGYPTDKGDILSSILFLSKTYNLLLFDFRHFGKSEGGYTTIGAAEQKDLLAAIHFLKSRGINKVGVWGLSLGGAVALMTASQAPEIKAIVSNSAFARLDWMARDKFRIPLLKYALGFLMGIWDYLFLGIDVRSVAPVEKVTSLTIPILIIHSKDDDFVPFFHALLLKKALKSNPHAEFWFLNGLRHGEFARDYEHRITNFFQKHF